MTQTLDLITRHRLVVIYRGIPAEKCLEASQALMEAGVSLFEVTLNSPGAIEAIELLGSRLGPEASVGAGTVMNKEAVEEAAGAGASFIISPNTNVDVIERTKKLGLVSIPGGFSPTEISEGWEAGADMVKVFPINVVGAGYLKQLRGPLNDIPFMPTGGVDRPEFVEELFRAGASAVGVGAQLLGQDLIDASDWSALQMRATAFLKAAAT